MDEQDAETPALRGARERARAEISAEILAAAQRQLAEVGASGLSLRAVTRELGMASSAIYRYVANRDELLTLLIVDAYDALGAAVEASAEASRPDAPAERLVQAASAVRTWATDHPNEYALVYGSPVPGYAAPQDTIGPASRVTVAIVGIVVDAQADGLLEPPAALPVSIPTALAADMEAIRQSLQIELSDDVLVRSVAAWTQMFGLVSFELFGQTRNVIEAHEQLLRSTVLAMARLLGLAETNAPSASP